MKKCTYCADALDHEERRHPRRDEAGAVMCDICYDRHYMDYCSRCEDFVEKTDLASKPGQLIGLWREAPALARQDMPPGYYRVLAWPFYADGMIEGYFHPRALAFVSYLDARGERRADEEQCLSGPLCSCCQGKVERLIPREDSSNDIERS